MGDFFLELLSGLFGGLVPARIGTVILAGALILCALVFAGIGAAVLFEVLSGAAPPALAIVTCLFSGLAWLSFRLARKGLRTASQRK